MPGQYHRPALLNEVIDALALKPGGTYIDCTVGGGGHSRGIAERIDGGLIIGIDRDPEALLEAEAALSGVPAKFVTFEGPFDRIGEALKSAGVNFVDGVLYDLGVSSHQLDDPGRGFTFRESDSPLDMRMSQTEETPTAADLLNALSTGELTTIFRDYADEKWGARIAQFVVERRTAAPYATAGQLVDTVKAAVPAAARAKDIHPATKTFQALRIAVNDEYGRLQRSLLAAIHSLKAGGRIVAISYHSGEDRIIKQTFSELAGKCVCGPQVPSCVCRARDPSIVVLTKKPTVPTGAEIAENPRSRSAKLRVAERLGR